jgi:hypothetical protein
LGAFARLQQQNREALANAKKQKKKKKKNVDESVLSGKKSEIKPSRGIGALTKNAAAQLGDKAVELRKKEAAKVSLPKLKIKNESITIEDANGNTFLEIIDIIKAPSLKDRLKEQSDNYQYGEFDKEVQEISRLHKSGQLTPEQRVKRLLQAKNLKRVKKP